ncbi:MAG: prephenate dehydrogenase [Candidatus Dormibacteria bacterium]
MGAVAIVGAGQIGTLIGLTLVEGAPPGLTGVGLLDDREGRALAAVRRGAGNEVIADSRQVLEADTVVLAIPVGEIVGWLHIWGPLLRPQSFLMDTGSSKSVVASAIRESVPTAVHAIGGHPICGNQRSGPEAAEAGSLSGSSFAITPVRADPTAELWGVELVEALRAVPIVVDPATHDRVLARTSHLLHLVSSALVELVLDQGIAPDLCRQLVGPAFRGMTRLAASDSEMVSSFLASNSAQTIAAANELNIHLHHLAALTSEPEQLVPLLSDLAKRRAELVGQPQ